MFRTDSSHIVLQRIMLCVAPHCNGAIRITKRHIVAKFASADSSVQNEIIIHSLTTRVSGLTSRLNELCALHHFWYRFVVVAVE